MNITNIDAPPGENELKLADLQAAPSVFVRPPRVATSLVPWRLNAVC
jgi:hypothetical protein